MNFDWAEWGPPLVVLAFGVAAGVIATLQLNRQGDASVQAQGREQDLIQAHEAALEALKSLELDQGKLDPSDYARERDALIARGSAALRELEAFREGRASDVSAPASPAAQPAAQPAAPVEKPMISPEWKGALTALAVVALVALLMQFIQGESVPRREGASMTGNQDLGTAPMQEQPGGEAPWAAAKAQLEARLAAEPNNVDLLNELTQMSLSTNDPSGAMRYNQAAFEVDPDNADAQVYKAVLAATVGMTDKAIEGLDAVLAAHPEHAKAWTYKGLILLEVRRHDEAATALEKAVALQPDIPPLQQALSRAKAMASAEVVLSGTATLSAEQEAALTGKEILYVSVRDPAGGPPLAAVRLPPGPFPVQFQVTTADAIAMGGAPRPFPESMSLSVRIDADGNPMTKGEEPGAELPVTKGSTGLQIELK